MQALDQVRVPVGGQAGELVQELVRVEGQVPESVEGQAGDRGQAEEGPMTAPRLAQAQQPACRSQGHRSDKAFSYFQASPRRGCILVNAFAFLVICAHQGMPPLKSLPQGGVIQSLDQG